MNMAPNEIMAQIPIKSNKVNKCVLCIKPTLQTNINLYLTIIYNKPTDSIIAELRCSYCNQLQKNILISEIEHIYSAFLSTKKAYDQQILTNYGHHMTISNINNMCIIYKQHIEKITADYIKLTEIYNISRQDNAKIICKCDEKQSEVDNANLEINKKQSEVDKANLEINKKQSEIDKANLEINKKQSEVDKANLEINKKQSEIDKANLEINKKQSEIDKANLEINKLKLKLNNTKSEQVIVNSKYIAKIENQNTELLLFNTRLSKHVNQNKLLESQNMELKSKNKLFESKNMELKSENMELKSKNKIFESQNMELKSKNKVLESQNMELKSENIILKNANKTLNVQPNPSCKIDFEIEKKYIKIIQTYEVEIIDLRDRLKKSENIYNMYKEGQKEKYLSIVNEYARRYELVKQQSKKDYFALELVTTNKYKKLLEEQGVDITYKHVVSEKYKAKLSLLIFDQHNPEFSKIQPIIIDDRDIKIQDPYNMLN